MKSLTTKEAIREGGKMSFCELILEASDKALKGE